jgi:hypothetical protein
MLSSLWSNKRKRDDEEADGEGSLPTSDQVPPPKISKTSTTPMREKNGLFILHPNDEAVAEWVFILCSALLVLICLAA